MRASPIVVLASKEICEVTFTMIITIFHSILGNSPGYYGPCLNSCGFTGLRGGEFCFYQEGASVLVVCFSGLKDTLVDLCLPWWGFQIRDEHHLVLQALLPNGVHRLVKLSFNFLFCFYFYFIYLFFCPRMVPAAWENARILKEDIVIQGYRIPPNVSHQFNKWNVLLIWDFAVVDNVFRHQRFPLFS